jgi:hypothetical protein
MHPSTSQVDFDFRAGPKTLPASLGSVRDPRLHPLACFPVPCLPPVSPSLSALIYYGIALEIICNPDHTLATRLRTRLLLSDLLAQP